MITKPIKIFKLKGNKVYINENVIEYENISDETREILESLISKGAYGSALLTLNMFYNVKTINEEAYTQEQYLSYLGECNSLMEECVVETKARNFRPLINLNGLEIMENANHIARGKGDILLIEDFRDNKHLNESDYTEMTVADYIYEAIDAGLVSLEDIGKAALSYMSSDDLEDMVRMNDFYVPNVFNPTGDDEEDMNEACEGTQSSDIAEKKDQEVGSLQKPKKPKKEIIEGNKPFIPDKIDKYVSNYNTKTGKKKQAKDFTWQYMAGKVDGMKVKGDKQTHIFNVDSGDYLGTYSDYMNEMFRIPKNHGFKGFRLDEQGHYIRGNYILINECGSIKAVNKNKLNETIVSKDLKTKDEYGNTVLDYDYAEKLMFQVIRTLNEKFKDYDYDFDFRIEGDTLKLFDTNEYFDYEDSNYEKVEQVVKQVIGDSSIYLEPENKVVMTIAGCYVK